MALRLPDVEIVAAGVHQAWIEAKLAQGIHSRPASNGEEQMVPYEKLSEQAKQLDRDTVKAVYAALKNIPHESLPMLGGTYLTQAGDTVKMIKINNVGTPYETLEDESGINRYSRRTEDMGRITGTEHDYSSPGNLVRPILAIRLDLLVDDPLSLTEIPCQG